MRSEAVLVTTTYRTMTMAANANALHSINPSREVFLALPSPGLVCFVEAKARVAVEILQAQDLALSAQVLQEFYVQATRLTKTDRITHEQASALIEAYLRFPVQETNVGLVRAALAAKSRYAISYRDAAIIEAARALSCDVLLSEDLDHGRDYDGVVVQNPFRN